MPEAENKFSDEEIKKACEAYGQASWTADIKLGPPGPTIEDNQKIYTQKCVWANQRLDSVDKNLRIPNLITDGVIRKTKDGNYEPVPRR